MPRITAAAPQALISDANHLAMALAYGPADGQTYGGLNWKDAQGNLYAAASFEASDAWVQAAQGALTRPAWDVQPYTISMAAAGRAQAALVFSTSPVAADPTKLTAVTGDSGPDTLAAMGLTAVETPTNG